MTTHVFIIVVLIVVVLAVLMWKMFRGSGTAKHPVWFDDIERRTIENTFWRDVIHTTDNMQIALMSTPPGDALGLEVHPRNDQFFRFERGSGILETHDPKTGVATNVPLKDGSAAIVPRGTRHNIINTGSDALKFYTIYSPPHHPPGTRDVTHADEIARESRS